MTRKLSLLLVVVTAASAVSLLQAQDRQSAAPAADGAPPTNACEFCQAARLSSAASTLGDSADGDLCQNCPSCSQRACPMCPSCSAESTELDPRVNATCQDPDCRAAQASAMNNLTAGLTDLPGHTSFIQEQSAQHTSQRDQLARNLAEYLVAGKHDPAHVHQVVRMALESAADAAHRQAMTYANNQPLAAAPARVLNPEPPAAYYVNNDIHHFPNQPATAQRQLQQTLPDDTRSEFQSASASISEPILDESQQTAMDLRQLQRDQDSMQELIQMMQQDLQRIAEDLSQLHVETRINQQRNAAPVAEQQTAGGNTRWPSVQQVDDPLQTFTTRIESPERRGSTASQVEYIAMLKQEVTALRHQLEQTQRALRNNASVNPIQQADFQQPSRLQPRRTLTMALTPTPERHESITELYYVGDLMQPPFHAATLQLMQFLKSNVDPDSWTDAYMMQITEPSISLVITQTRENHQQIKDLLRQVRSGARSYTARPQRQDQR